MSVFTTKTIDYLSSIYNNKTLESSVNRLHDEYDHIIKTCKLLKKKASIKFDKVNVKKVKQTENQRMNVYIYISNNRHLLTTPLSPTETHFLDLIKGNQCTLDYFSQWFNRNRGKNLANDILNLIEYKEIPNELIGEDINVNVFGDFTPEPIHYEIHTTMNKQVNYTLNYNEFQVNFKMNSSLKDKTRRIIVNDILYRSLILQAMNPSNIEKKTIDLELFSSKYTKQLPMVKGDVCGPDNINSGVTTYYYDKHINNKTMVFRKEEMKKLVLHELIHNLGYDFVTLTITFNAHLYFNISPHQKITINEAYTESIACIINCMISSYEINHRKNFKLFSDFLVYEMTFSLFQTAKILLHYGFDSAEDFIRPYNKSDKFKQNTSVFSYFFVKTGLLFSLSKFADFLKKYADCFYITNKPEAAIAYKKLIIDCCMNKDYMTALNHFIKKNKIPAFLRDTLRMTCIEV
jgi:hypothetical protein